MVSFSIGTIQTEIQKYLNLSYIPVQYLWIVPIAFIALAVMMEFYSVATWRFALGLIGLVGGYFEVMHLTILYGFSLTVFGTPLPSYLLPLIAGVLTAILLSLIVRFAISAALAYLIYYEMGIHFAYNLSIVITVAIVAFAISWFFYTRIVQIVSKAIGTVILFIGLTMLNVPVLYAAIISAIVLLIAGVWMMDRKKIKAKVTAWWSAFKAKRQMKKAQVTVKEKVVAEVTLAKDAKGGEKGMSIVGKIVRTPAKIVRAPLKLFKKTEEEATEEAPVKHVRKDGSVE